jgi:molybdate transport system substrate-binding protein
MARRVWRIAFGCLLLPAVLQVTHGIAHADEITFLCAGALRSAVTQLAPEFTAATGHQVKPVFGPIGAHTERVRKEGPADLAIVSPAQWDELAKEGKIDKSIGSVIAKVGIGVFIKKGGAKPDIGSVEAFKTALLKARSIALGDPAGGSPVGAYAVVLFERLGIRDPMTPKLRLVKGAVPIEPVTKGDAEIGFAQTSEIVPVGDVELVGPLPGELQKFTVYKAAIPLNARAPAAAKALADFLASPKAAAAIKSAGLEPAAQSAR